MLTKEALAKMTPQEKAAAVLQYLKDTVLEVVKSEPMGAPSGVLYAGLMSAGITLEVYNRIIDDLVKEGKIKNSGHLLTWLKD